MYLRLFLASACAWVAAGLRPLVHVDWRRLPDLPAGFQDSDGGFFGDALVTAFGYSSGDVPGFKNYGWALRDDRWTFVPSAPAVPMQEVAAARAKGRLYYVGGFSYLEPRCFKTVVSLGRTGRWGWRTHPDLPWCISSAGVAAVGCTVYAYGGYQYDGSAFYANATAPGTVPAVGRIGSRLLALDVCAPRARQRWVERAMGPGTPRAAHAVVAHDRALWVFGGYFPEAAATVVDNWRYDVDADRWDRLPDTPVSSGNFPGGNVVWRDRYVLLFGGNDEGRVAVVGGGTVPSRGGAQKICTWDHTLRRAPGCRPWCMAGVNMTTDEYFNDVFVFDLATGEFGTATGSSRAEPGLLPPSCGPLPMNNNLGQVNVRGDRVYLLGGECDARTIKGTAYGHYPALALVGELSAAL